MNFDTALAQEICDQIACELQVTISFVDQEGRIIASSEHHRINDSHVVGAAVMAGEIDYHEITAEEAEINERIREGVIGAIGFGGRRIACLAVGAPLEKARQLWRIARAWTLSNLRVQEIAAKKSLEEKEQVRTELGEISALIELTFDSMGQAISIVDANLQLVAFNRKYEEMLDFPPGLVEVGMGLNELFRFNARRGEYGPGNVDQHVTERLERAHRFERHKYERVRPDGTVLEVIGQPLPGRRGFVTIYTDVTENRHAQKALAEKSELLEATFENMDQGICVIGRDLRLAAYNDRFLELNECLEDVGIGTPFRDFLLNLAIRGEFGPTASEEELALKVDKREQLLRDRVPHRFQRESCSGLVLDIHASPLPDGDGVIITYSDITVMKEREREVAEQSMLLSVIQDNIDQGVTLFDADMRLQSSNQRAVEILDLPTYLMEQKASLEDIFRYNAKRGDYGEGDIELLVHERIELARKMQPHRFERTRPNGTVIEIRGKPLPDRSGFVTTYTDITEIRLTEREAAEKSILLEATLENVEQGITMKDADLNVLAYNKRALELIGLPDDFLNGHPPLEKMYRFMADRGDFGPGDPDQHVQDRLAEAEKMQPHRYERTRWDGMILEISSQPLPDRGGFVTTLSDVTERRRAERELRELLESSPVGVSVLEPKGKLLFCNSRLVELVGGKIEDVTNLDLRSRFADPKQRDQVTQELREKGVVRDREVQFMRLNAPPIWALLTMQRTSFEGRPATLSWVYDITDLKGAQENLLQAEKMASLGSLVAGVAHEINTPVGITVSAASHLEVKVQEVVQVFEDGKLRKGDFKAFLEVVKEASQLLLVNSHRAADLIQSFKRVAVDQTSDERRSFNVKEYIEEVLLSLKPRLKKTKHTVAIDCHEKLIIDGYPGALSQLLTNLVMNSLIHAFPDRNDGAITIKVDMADDDGVLLLYSDDGIGIPSDNLKKIFDPFFTTKRGSGGSGLGMNIVYNLATRTLGGRIEAMSEVGKGTSFSLLFPRNAPKKEIVHH